MVSSSWLPSFCRHSCTAGYKFCLISCLFDQYYCSFVFYFYTFGKSPTQICIYLALKVSPQKAVTGRQIWRSYRQLNIHIWQITHKDLNTLRFKLSLFQSCGGWQVNPCDIFFNIFCALLNFWLWITKYLSFNHRQAHFHVFLLNGHLIARPHNAPCKNKRSNTRQYSNLELFKPIFLKILSLRQAWQTFLFTYAHTADNFQSFRAWNTWAYLCNISDYSSGILAQLIDWQTGQLACLIIQPCLQLSTVPSLLVHRTGFHSDSSKCNSPGLPAVFSQILSPYRRAEKINLVYFVLKC